MTLLGQGMTIVLIEARGSYSTVLGVLRWHGNGGQQSHISC